MCGCQASAGARSVRPGEEGLPLSCRKIDVTDVCEGEARSYGRRCKPCLTLTVPHSLGTPGGGRCDMSTITRLALCQRERAQAFNYAEMDDCVRAVCFDTEGLNEPSIRGHVP